MKNKKVVSLIVMIIENLLLGVVKFWIIAMYGLAAFLDDYIIPLTTFQKITTFGTGIIIAVVLDLLVNFIIYKIFNRKEKNISYKKFLVSSLIITALLVILMFI